MSFYLKIDGIDGNVSSQGHTGWIGVNSLQHGVKRNLNVTPGKVADREGTTPQISELILTKKVDKASPRLFAASCSGGSQGTILIHACHTGSQLETFLQYTLSDGVISNYEVIGMSDEHSQELQEKLHINFTKMEMKFTPRDASNRAGHPIVSSYDLKTAKTG